LPVDEVNVAASCAVPETVGGAVLAGGEGAGGVGAGGAGAGAGETTAEAALVTAAEPAVFDAVTTTRRVAPTSLVPRANCAVVAPEIDEQLEPALSQRRHWYA